MKHLALALFIALVSACGSAPRGGECEDYKPIDTCQAGWRMECETTEDGCEQCTCVPLHPDDHGPVFPE